MRILLAGLAGALAMFVWTAIAHMATPLGQVGFHQIPNESAVLHTMNDSIGTQGGLYFFPWVDLSDPKAMEKSAALEKTGPSGMLLYRGPGQGMDSDMTPMLIKEFLKQLGQALIAAWIVSMIAAGFVMRAGVVAAIGVSASIATNVSYWNWYGFPLDFTMAAIVIEVVGAIAAGIAIAAVLPRKTV